MQLKSENLLSRCPMLKLPGADRLAVCIYFLMLLTGFGQEMTPPQIWTQPKGTLVAAGFLTLMGVTSETGKYQWYKDGNPVVRGTNSSLSFNPAQLSDSGWYHCVVSNSAGSTTSKVAQLTVVPRAELRSLSTLPFPRPPTDLKVTADRMYVASGTLQIFDVANKAAPQSIGSYSSARPAITKIFIAEKTAFCAVNGGIEIVDITNPAEPVLQGMLSFTNRVHDLVVREGRAYVGCEALQIWDVQDAKNPRLLSEYKGDTGWSVALAEREAVLYSVGSHTEVQVYDISDPQVPSLISTLTEGSYEVAVHGDRLCSYPHLAIHDISDTSKPLLISGVNGGNSGVVETTEDALVISTLGGSGMVLTDATLPSAQFALGRFEFPAPVSGVTYEKGFFYVRHGSTLEILEYAPAVVAPVITRSLRNSLGVAGTDVKMEAAASGGEPLRWQWYKDELPLLNETNRVLWLRGLSEDDGAQYSAVASNSAGSTSSGLSRLTLIEPPPFAAEVSPRFFPGPRLTSSLPDGLHVTLEGSSNLLSWERIWSGQATNEPLKVYDYLGLQAPARFYRLRYGN